ncbi:DUF2236 domain-containing protein [Amnibacterium flavum]|uniref:DUF2236 domain-containing protein n=1 Tax=Amnibacterium flavum TaxID=2173173 RepID=A0A2V1HV07_9MICO|nr:DUF2236 domain-containing protein [Amnibacterium flavum]
MGRAFDPIRQSLLRTLTNEDESPPEWVSKLERGDDGGYFPQSSAAWAVHGDLPTIVAGIRALLTQALHPGALAGVHDHSRYREDPFGRLAGTIRWIFTVTYGSTDAADSATGWVQHIHQRVRGVYPGSDGEPIAYAADDPDLLRWVHLAFTDAFLGAHLVWGARPIPGGPDAYVAEWAKAGEMMGVAAPPRTHAELRAQLREYLDAGILRYDERVADVVRFLRRPPLPRALKPTYPLLFRGAVASMDDEYRALLGLPTPRGPVRLPTALVLDATGRLIGRTTGAEVSALARLERLGLTRP